MNWPPPDGRRIVVVEPHADDAFLSLGGHIAAWVADGRQVTILTVYSGTRNRADDAEAYADAVGAAWRGLGVVESDPGLDSGAEVPEPPRVRRPAAWVVAPLGLQHPEHRAVRDATVADAWYVEIPYAYKTKLAGEVTGALDGRSVVSWLRPHGRKWRHAKLFKDQARFFYYNPPEEMTNMAEVIVR